MYKPYLPNGAHVCSITACDQKWLADERATIAREHGHVVDMTRRQFKLHGCEVTTWYVVIYEKGFSPSPDVVRAHRHDERGQ